MKRTKSEEETVPRFELEAALRERDVYAARLVERESRLLRYEKAYEILEGHIRGDRYGCPECDSVRHHAKDCILGEAQRIMDPVGDCWV